MKKTFILLLLFSLFGVAFSKPIDETTAKLVGQNFLTNRTTSTLFKSGVSLELSYLSASKINSSVAAIKATNYFYVFNVSNGDGYVIVSADDNASPILGYSDEIDFNPTNIPSNTQKWLESYKNEIRYIIQNNIIQTLELTNDWKGLIKGNTSTNSLGKKAAVSPLVQTKWNQSPYVNDLCPYDNSEAARSVTGCPATAMAQIMKFWNYPATGTGFHSYNHNKYGTLSANFASTTYNWSSMPNIVNSTNSAVATLMYHCGVSVDMNYSPSSSGSFVIINSPQPTANSEYAYKTYFGYNPTTIHGLERKDYTDNVWKNLLKTELDNSRPIQYAGFGSGGGHTFVCDGYDNNDFFHMNWGWGGQEDGFFNINALNPGSLGTGGGTGGYNAGQQAVIGIQPPTGVQTYNLDITVDVNASSSSISYGGAFSITTNIKNVGANTFNGDYCAAVFDSKGIFVDYVATITGTSLPPNYTYNNNLVFSNSGNYSFLPGSYNVYIYYRPTGGSWKQIHASGLFTYEHAAISFTNANSIEMYSSITPSVTTFFQGQSASVNLNLKNNSSPTFFGQYQVNLYNLDGTFAETIGTYNEINGLSSGYIYNSPYLTFTNSVLASEPGTYLLAVMFKTNTASNWNLVGSTNYQNPIKIDVQAPPFSPDIFEPNNTQVASYNLPLNFTNNTANVNSQGSNIHLGNDYDYYKVVLPSGYNYSIASRINDSYKSGNSQIYTVDGLVSYSTDGIIWSDAFDDVIPNNIIVNGGGTIYFLVSPYFTGNTGTYLFEANITRSAIASTAKDITAFTATGIVGSATINNSNATVSLKVSSTTNVTSLAPIISVSNFASISPTSGVARDFTNPVTYTVTAQDASTKQWVVTVTKQSSGIGDISLDESINVYPNPGKDQLNIDVSNFIGQIKYVSLVDMQGKEMLVEFDSPNNKINLNNLTSGFYLLHIETDNGICNKKIIIQ